MIYLIEEGNILLQSLPKVLHFEMNEQRDESYLGNINGLIRVEIDWKEIKVKIR